MNVDEQLPPPPVVADDIGQDLPNQAPVMLHGHAPPETTGEAPALPPGSPGKDVWRVRFLGLPPRPGSGSGRARLRHPPGGTWLWAGLHEMLDQIGAVAKPLLVAGALFTVATARAIFPAAARFEPDEDRTPPARAGRPDLTGARAEPNLLTTARAALGRPFWLYVAFTAVAVAGFAHFELIAYHIKARG